MVQRTRLALILLLALVVSFLFSQVTPEFTPPRFLSEPILEVPDSYKNLPNDILILVEVKTDSTAILIKILDGEQELKPDIENLLPYLMFIPATQKGNPISTTLSIKLLVRKTSAMQQTSKAIVDSVNIIDKEALSTWINRQRTMENRQLIFSAKQDSSGRFSPQINDTFYSTNYYMMGINKRPYLIINDGFIQPGRIYYNALSYQMYSNFRDVTVRNDIISFANDRYPFAATCTDVYAGLGDYEFNFARGQVMKNHLFGIKNFYTEFGFLVQNGWWQETISDQTSSRLFLSLPYKNTTLSFNFEKYDQNIPSTTLLPGMQNGNLFRIGHKLQDIYLKYDTPWVNVGWQTETETFDSAGNIYRQKHHISSYLLNKTFNSRAADIDISYQYNYQRGIISAQSLYQYNYFPMHQFLATINKQFHRWDYTALTALSNDKLHKFNFDLGYKNIFGRLGLIHKVYSYSRTHSRLDYVTSSIYNSTKALEIFHGAYTKQELAASYSLPSRENINVKFVMGSREIISDNYRYFASDTLDYVYNWFADSSKETNTSFVESFINIRKQIGLFTASLDQTLQWTQYKKGLYEQPEFTGQTRLKLVRELRYKNALSAGLNMTGHTDYIQADSRNLPIYGSMIADAWCGVKITDLFEFQLMMKNIGDNTIFGLYPHPRTIIGTIHWFYLN